jgi:hypothetical protein
MTTKLGHEEAVRRLAEKHVTIAPCETTTVEVALSGRSRVLRAYVAELASNVETTVGIMGGSIELTEEDLSKYVAMLVKLRIDYVNNRKIPYGLRPTDHICVPSFVSLVLQSIGVVHHLELGLELRPVYIDDEEIDPDFIIMISRKIAALGSYGLEYAKGYERSKDGSFEFMTMCVIDDKVMSFTRDKHPVFALLSSFLDVRGAETVLQPRVTYGTTRHFASLMGILASTKV